MAALGNTPCLERRCAWSCLPAASTSTEYRRANGTGACAGEPLTLPCRHAMPCPTVVPLHTEPNRTLQLATQAACPCIQRAFTGAGTDPWVGDPDPCITGVPPKPNQSKSEMNKPRRQHPMHACGMGPLLHSMPHACVFDSTRHRAATAQHSTARGSCHFLTPLLAATSSARYLPR